MPAPPGGTIGVTFSSGNRVIFYKEIRNNWMFFYKIFIHNHKIQLLQEQIEEAQTVYDDPHFPSCIQSFQCRILHLIHDSLFLLSTHFLFTTSSKESGLRTSKHKHKSHCSSFNISFKHSYSGSVWDNFFYFSWNTIRDTPCQFINIISICHIILSRPLLRFQANYTNLQFPHLF